MIRSHSTLDAFSTIPGGGISRRRVLRGAATGLVVAGVGGVLRVAPQAVAQEDTSPGTAVASPVATRAHHFQVGQRDLWVFDDGDYTAPGSLFAVNAPPQALAEAMAEIGQSPEAYTTTLNVLLIDTGDELVLIDTGFGPTFPTTGQLLGGLQAEGITPDDIDVVLLTHMHLDHFGGAVDAAGKPVFPNARYLINQTEYEFWWAEPSLAEWVIPDDIKQLFRESAKATLGALQDALEPIAPGDEIASGVTVRAAPGHTPGHLAVEVAFDGERLIHTVDAASDPVLHLKHPDWFIAADNWPAHEILTRRRLFDRAAREHLLVQTYHFPFPGLGHVQQDGDTWLWIPVP